LSFVSSRTALSVGRDAVAVASLVRVEASFFDSQPTRICKEAQTVMFERTSDELAAIEGLWRHFEQLVGLRGRRMYAMVEPNTSSYATCTPVKDDDDPDLLGLSVGELPGGWYLRARLAGDPPALYERIGPAMEALKASAEPVDTSRPLVEYYRRHREIELWVPVFPGPS
jgi:hypothetical protein